MVPLSGYCVSVFFQCDCGLRFSVPFRIVCAGFFSPVLEFSCSAVFYFRKNSGRTQCPYIYSESGGSGFHEEAPLSHLSGCGGNSRCSRVQLLYLIGYPEELFPGLSDRLGVCEQRSKKCPDGGRNIPESPVSPLQKRASPQGSFQPARDGHGLFVPEGL